jgi:hypothetical protein
MMPVKKVKLTPRVGIAQSVSRPLAERFRALLDELTAAPVDQQVEALRALRDWDEDIDEHLKRLDDERRYKGIRVEDTSAGPMSGVGAQPPGDLRNTISAKAARVARRIN